MNEKLERKGLGSQVQRCVTGIEKISVCLLQDIPWGEGFPPTKKGSSVTRVTLPNGHQMLTVGMTCIKTDAKKGVDYEPI